MKEGREDLSEDDPRKVLGLHENVGPNEIKKAYRRLTRLHLPERDLEAFKKIRWANEALFGAGALLFGLLTLHHTGRNPLSSCPDLASRNRIAYSDVLDPLKRIETHFGTWPFTAPVTASAGESPREGGEKMASPRRPVRGYPGTFLSESEAVGDFDLLDFQVLP